MRVAGGPIIFLLTVFFGLSVSLSAQVEVTDSTKFPLERLRDADSSSSASKQSTDSVYAVRPESNDSPLQHDVIYYAEDSIPNSLDGNTVELYNQAVVEYGSIKMEAGYIRIEFEKNEIFAQGLRDSTGQLKQKPVFTEAGKQYRADEMRYNFQTKKARINKVITQEGEGFLHGETVKMTGDQVFYIKNGSFTTCSHEHPHFRIVTPKAKVITGKKVVTQFAYIEVIDVPTPLMVPFGFFPTTSKRKSGIILPTYGNSQFRGYFLKNMGFYWATNEYMDLSLTGDLYTQGGFGLRASSTYKKRYAYSGNLTASYNLLRYGREEFAEFIPGSFNNSSDFAVSWSHRQDPKANPSFRFSANVNVASAQFFKITSVNPNEVQQNRLNSSLSFSKSWPNRPFRLNATINHSQNNQTKDLTLTLPQVNFATNRLFPFKRESSVGKKKWYEEIGITYTANAKNQIETRLDKPIFSPTVFRDSSRAGIQHTVPIAANYKVFKFFVFNPSVNYVERWYPNKLQYRFVDSINRAVVDDTVNGFFANRNFSANANLSTKLYGLWRYRGFLKALRHQMTPNVGFSYQPDFSTPFWGMYENIGLDTNGNEVIVNPYSRGVYGSAPANLQGSVNIGVQNTLEAKVRDRSDSSGMRKIKILERFSLNTGYNMAADEFQWRNINLTASSSMFDRLIRMNYNATFDLYGFDEETNRRVSDYAFNVNDQLFRTTNQRFTLGLNMNAKRFNKKKGGDKEENRAEEESDGPAPQPSNLGITDGDIDYYRLGGYVDFEVPWSLNMNYNLTSSSPGGREPTIRQSLTFNGDITLTKGWKVGFSSGYDFEQQDFTITTFDFYRDLHCWELRCSWVPIGVQQTYFITIRVKASMLSDLKLERRRGLGDFQP